MSFSLHAEVQKTKVGNPSAKALLLALASFADDNGANCFPGQDALSSVTELSLDTIQRQLKFLVDRGFITAQKSRRKGHWASWNYTIVLASQAAPCGSDQTAPCGTDQAAPCGSVAADQAAPCGPTMPHGAALPSRTMRLNSVNYSVTDSAALENSAELLSLEDGLKEVCRGLYRDPPAMGIISTWLLDGIAPGTIRTVCTAKLKRKADMESLAWCDKAVREAHAVAGSTEASGSIAPDKAWHDILKRYKQSGEWTRHTNEFGPDPSSPNCRVPAHLLAEYGYARSAA